MPNGSDIVMGRYGTIGEVFFSLYGHYWSLNTTPYVNHFCADVYRAVQQPIQTLFKAKMALATLDKGFSSVSPSSSGHSLFCDLCLEPDKPAFPGTLQGSVAGRWGATNTHVERRKDLHEGFHLHT
jgi:hypothetical protein